MAKKKRKEPSRDLVKVQITIPRGLDSIIRKLSALEGTTADSWYVDLVTRELQSLFESPEYLLDYDRVIALNGLTGIITPPR